ncbi:unnamed protein product [Gongylonema pulchrum]|uniref:DUF148 domain-containing protein n=1 Tax=Gongylonema pulchrum TaxID=637853 RepID=A0A183D8H4_9BILA|nr:unnamed protein product [Gongylonema pulchrum]
MMKALIFLEAVCLTACIAQQPSPSAPPDHGPIGFILRSPEQKVFSHMGDRPEFLPPFLQKSTPEARQQFFDIVKNGSITIDGMQEKLKQWLNSQNDQVKVHLFYKNQTLIQDVPVLSGPLFISFSIRILIKVWKKRDKVAALVALTCSALATVLILSELKKWLAAAIVKNGSCQGNNLCYR